MSWKFKSTDCQVVEEISLVDTEWYLEPALAAPALELRELLASGREEPGMLTNTCDKQGHPRQRIVPPQIKSAGAEKLCST